MARKRERFGGTEGNIRWVAMTVQDIPLCVPEKNAQFAVSWLQNVEKSRWVVVRIHTGEAVPINEAAGWLGEYDELGLALQEAKAREHAWQAFAVDMLGQASAQASAGRPSTLFEQKAYEKRRDPRLGGNRSLTPAKVQKEASRRQAKRMKVKYPAPQRPEPLALPAPEASE